MTEVERLRQELREAQRETLDWVEIATEANTRAIEAEKQLAELRAEIMAAGAAKKEAR